MISLVKPGRPTHLIYSAPKDTQIVCGFAAILLAARGVHDLKTSKVFSSAWPRCQKWFMGMRNRSGDRSVPGIVIRHPSLLGLGPTDPDSCIKETLPQREEIQNVGDTQSEGSSFVHVEDPSAPSTVPPKQAPLVSNIPSLRPKPNRPSSWDQERGGMPSEVPGSSSPSSNSRRSISSLSGPNLTRFVQGVVQVGVGCVLFKTALDIRVVQNN